MAKAICNNCSKSFSKSIGQLKKHNLHFCCRKCRNDYVKIHPNWRKYSNGNKTEAYHKIRRLAEMYKKNKEVKKNV